MSLNSAQPLYYVIKFVSDLRQVGTPVSSTNKTDRHDISEILLKVVLNTTNQTKPSRNTKVRYYPSQGLSDCIIVSKNVNIYFSGIRRVSVAI